MKPKRIVIIFVLLLAVGLGVFLLIPKGRDLSKDVARAGTGKARAIEIVKPSASDLVFKLDEKNVSIGFTAGKSIAGKIVNVSGGWSGKFGSHLTGTAIVDPKTRKLRQVQIEIDVASLWSEHEMLTKNLKTCGFFNIKDHPTATFISTGVESAPPAATTGTSDTPQFAATHVLEGNFKLNGIEKLIRVPVRVEENPNGSKIESRFSIDRKDFDVIFRDNSAFPILNDSNILPGVSLKVI
ncbi:MAG: YceI family protein, partial [Verrucomicrobiota bacterium]